MTKVYENEKIKTITVTTKVNVPLLNGNVSVQTIENTYHDTDIETKYFLLDNTVKKELEKVFFVKDIKSVLETMVLENFTTYGNMTFNQKMEDFKNSKNQYYSNLQAVMLDIYQEVDKMQQENGAWLCIPQYKHTYLKPSTCNLGNTLIKPLLYKDLNKNIVDKLNIYASDYDGISIFLKSENVYYGLKNGEKQFTSYSIKLKQLINQDIDGIIEYNYNHEYPIDTYNIEDKEERKKLCRKEIEQFFKEIIKK